MIAIIAVFTKRRRHSVGCVRRGACPVALVVDDPPCTCGLLEARRVARMLVQDGKKFGITSVGNSYGRERTRRYRRPSR